MLKAEHRLRRSRNFTTTMRRGRAARGASVVVHVAVGEEERSPAKVGFVVGRAVGGAVVRNAVRRRLRHVMADRIDRLPPGSSVVVRALPRAARSTTRTMANDVDHALGTALRRARSR